MHTALLAKYTEKKVQKEGKARQVSISIIHYYIGCGFAEYAQALTE
jgi:hypothetical protein